MIKIIFLCFTIIFAFALQQVRGAACPNNKVVVCYWGSWAVYRPIPGTHKIEYIQPEFCTHLIYTFAGINLNGALDSLDYHNDVTMGNYRKFIELKEEFPCVKILLAFGGWTEGSEKYSYMVETEERRQYFVESVMRFILYFGFDGLDIDWEYPAARGGISDDKENFNRLLELFHEQLSKRNKILTAAVAASQYTIKTAYNIPEMCEYLDLVNIMGYDMQFTDKTSSHAPLKRESSEANSRDTLDTTVEYFIKNGCPKEKLVLGIPSFARTFTLRSTSSAGLGAAVTGVGNAGSITQTNGFLGFNEVCKNVTTGNGWKITHLQQNAVKYASKGNQWVTYDDPDTVKQKAQYAKQKGLAGVMFWSIDTDDFNGDCYGQCYPLLNAANNGLGNKI